MLEAAYRYALEHGLAHLSLRPLATAIGSSPRVLVFLFGNKDGLTRALLARARADELAILNHVQGSDDPQAIGLATAVTRLWGWLAGAEHQQLLKLWAETYATSLVEPEGVWGGFAAATVHDWLTVLADCQSTEERDSPEGAGRRTLALAVLRGALLDLLATGDHDRVTAAVHHQLAVFQAPAPAP
ncbi:TetR/AcrR family transcriptional regulator [Micromonospora sp. PLK6-60]|nr:TetR/AcrR family transcriptional regulator [Micromonospora sp. PLK6-60]